MTLQSKQVTIVYNPQAGAGNLGLMIPRIAEDWQEQGWHVNLSPTKHSGHAVELARSAANENVGVVLAAGGDGTLNEVANGLAHSESILAPLPVGTANMFAKELNLPCPNFFEPERLLDASRALLRGTIQHMDLGQCDNERYWLLWASTGVDSFVASQIEPRSRLVKQLGVAGYVAQALFFLPGYPRTSAIVRVDQETVYDDFLMITVSNCRHYGSGDVRLNPHAVLDDGQFEVWLFRGQFWAETARYVIGVGLDLHVDDPNVKMLSGTHVAVETTPRIPYHLDGEPIGQTPFSCQIHHNALRVLVPETTPPGLFNKVGESLASW
ncbi:diacylglycerol kinase family lipid kinase [Chloroflexi bacterium TSY]|nr:diacylglycerol kinase family lipid kinase [Chloroflexi bacterium TSY]